MSNWDIRFPKNMQDKAAVKGKQLFAIGFMGGGRGEACMFWDSKDITLMWLMAHYINKGMTPRQAIDEAEKAMAAKEAIQ